MTGRVLVVDDILANVKVLEARLSAEYFDVFTAYSGEEALDTLANGVRPELIVILSDINMPGMDGLSLLREIKTRRPDLPVTMVTG